MEEDYRRMSEELTSLIGELIMSCNDEGVEYDDWRCHVNMADSYGSANIQNIEFRLDYSHDNDKAINDLEDKAKKAIFDNSEEIEILRRDYYQEQ